MTAVRRKCFISYHHEDQTYCDRFVSDFDHAGDCFIARGLGTQMPGDVIESTNPEYVMRRIREQFLADSTVTIVLLGRCTWARKYIDWEIQASLRSGQVIPSGLIGIKLPTFNGIYPDRLHRNLSPDWPRIDCYARVMDYPRSTQDLVNAIERAFERRTTHHHFINNPRQRMSNNRNCL